MTISIQPCPQFPGCTTLDVSPDVGTYARVTMDGAQAGTYSVEVVSGAGWADDVVKNNILQWFGMTEVVS